jgi:hypothetical protein
MNWDTTIGAKSFRPPSDTTSYFDKITAAAEQKIRAEINQQVRDEANKVIHGIVNSKDTEIENLKQALAEKDLKLAAKQSTIDSLNREKRHFIIPEELEFKVEEPAIKVEADVDNFTQEVISIFKYGKSESGFVNEDQEKVRKVALIWKQFFEEYKWKSNYISVKIKKLLKDTDSIL